MTRVVVVDDELLVRVGVASCIAWEEHGFAIVGQASGGREALDIVQREGADIVMTDIVMPGMDGLELIAELGRSHPAVRVVVLSCHSDMEYVKAAMKLGAVDYVLKLSLRPDDLLRVLEEARAGLPAAPEALPAPLPEVEAALACLRARLPKAVDLTSYGRGLRSALRSGAARGVGAVALRLERRGDVAKKARSCLAIAESTSDPACRIVGLGVDEATIALTILLDRAGPAVPRRLRALCVELRERTVGLLDVDSVWAYIAPPSGAARIAEPLLDALRALEHAFFLPAGSVADGPPACADGSARVPPADEASLSDYLASGDAAGYRRVLSVLVAGLTRPDAYTPEAVRRYLAGVYLRLLESSGADARPPSLDAIMGAPALYLIERELEDLATHSVRVDRDSPRMRPEIVRVREHVRAHLSERISVRQAAAVACMSPNHFSTTFRRETSESFVQFVNRLKIEKARRLIAEGHLVYQAAEAVGITDIPYFSKLFKRITGSSPSETRG